jgi:dipeptidase E
LHLFSIPGDGNINYILEACRPYLEGQGQPLVAFIQWASVQNDWLEYTCKAFTGLAQVEALDPDPSHLADSKRSLERCEVVYISGGNTYLLNDRLHESGLCELLRQRALEGLPVVGFSAGALVCGPNILTTHDINMLPTRHFNSLDLLPYNIVAHYPSTEAEREDEDDWLSDYHARHVNPILALENDAYVRWDGQSMVRVRGTAWMLEAGMGRTRLD